MKDHKFKDFILKIFYLSPVFLFILMLVFYCNCYSERSVFPALNITTIPYSDKDNDGGNSSIKLIRSSGQISFNYELKSGFINPYAGVCFYFHKPIDLRRAQGLLFKLKSSTSVSIKIVVLTEIPGYTTKQSALSYLHLQKEIPVSTDFSEVLVKLQDLYTPDWWFENEIREEDRRFKKDLSKVHSLMIQSSTIKNTDIPDNINIEEIVLISRNPVIILLFSLVTILDLLAILLFLRIQKAKKSRNKIKGFIKSFFFRNSENLLSHDLLKIIEFIGLNYSNANLKLYMVKQACNIQENQISRLLKNHFQLGFLQYLNMIRLTEAKRLLMDTDLRISEIAYKTGFNSMPHFSRSFKKKEEITPGAFRKLSKKSSEE